MPQTPMILDISVQKVGDCGHAITGKYFPVGKSVDPAGSAPSSRC
jgi:hypothetical protein